MAANLLAIDNLFIPAAPAARQVNLPIPRKNAHTEQPDRAASLQDTRPPCTDTPDKPTLRHETATDNAVPQATQKPKMQSQGDFSHNLRSNIAANSARRNPQNNKPEGQNAGTPIANQPNIVQLWLAQYHIEHHGKEGCSKKPDPKAGRQLAQSLAQLKSAKLPAAGENKANTASQPAGGATSDTATARAAATDTVFKPEQTDAGNPNQLSKEPLVSTNGSKSPKAGDQSAAQYGRQPAPFGQNTPTRNAQNLVISNKATATPVAEPASEKTLLQATTAAEKNGISEVPKAPLLDPKAASAQLKSPALNPQPLDNTEEPTHAARQTSHNGPLVFAHSGSADGKHAGKNLSTKAAAQNLNITGLRITTAQAKNGDGAAPNNAFNTESDNPMSGFNLQSPASETSSQAFGPMTKTHNLSEEQNLPHIGRQILESIKTSLAQNQPNQRITIRLNPPELGRVSIEFRQNQDHITGILQVSKLQTRDELQHLLPEIVRTLQDAGINLKRLDLELTDQGQQHHYKDQSLHDQESSSQPHHSQQQAPETTLTDDAAHYDTYAPRLLFTENQVDMLI